ncbi:MAG: phosphatidylglycerophosphatase A [Desulfobacteraceae bacterium]
MAKEFILKIDRNTLVLFAATGGLAGKIPFAPGTFGTLVGVLPVLLIHWLGADLETLAVVVLILGAVWVSQEAEVIIGEKDPGSIVIDEIAGYAVAMAGMPVNLYTLGAGFLIFRFFDIVKPPPVRQFEKKFTRGPGIVLDDIAAGLLTGIVLRLVF